MRAIARLLAGAVFLVAFAQGATMAPGQQQAGWNGTWVGGWETGHGTQIVFAGDELIAVYWHDDYVSGVHASAAPGGAGLRITWPTVEALLSRGGDNTAHIVIHETGQPDVAFPLTRDHS